MRIERYAAAALTALALTVPAFAQVDPGNPLETFGSGTYNDLNAKATKAYRQGAKYRQRAEKATEPAERETLYQKALEKFGVSVGYIENFDARLAMGEIHLALGDTEEAFKSCYLAKSLKPRNDRALQCYEAAGGKAE